MLHFGKGAAALFGGLLLLNSTTAFAQTQADAVVCNSMNSPPDRALVSCEAFLQSRRDVSGKRLTLQQLAVLHVMKGNALLRLGDVKAAIEEFDRSILFDPKLGLSIAFRGAAKWLLGDEHGAFADWESGIATSATPVVVAAIHQSRGLAFRSKRRHGEAIADFTEAIKRNPRAAPPYKQRAEVHLFLGERQKAEMDIKMAIQLEPASKKFFEEEFQLAVRYVEYLYEIERSGTGQNWNPSPTEMLKNAQ